MNLGGTIRLNRLGVIIIIGACILLMIYLHTNGIEDIIKSGKNTNSINLRRLLIAAIEVAEKGGNEVISVKNTKILGERSKGKTKEGIDDLLTKADSKSHCVMFYSLKHSFPKIKIISEEGGSTIEKDCNNLSYLGLDLDPNVLLSSSSLSDVHIPAEDVTVWIDPLDATKEYTENYVQYVSTMVCVAVKGEPIIGVIHKPFDIAPRTSWAWVKNGLSPNLKYTDDNQVRDNTEPPVNCKIIISMSHAGEAKNMSEKAFGKTCEITSAAGAGYKALEVASKNATAYLHTTTIKKWDICAGNAILKALGGKMTTLTGAELDYSSKDNAGIAKGLLATLENHDWFLNKLIPVTVNPVSDSE